MHFLLFTHANERRCRKCFYIFIVQEFSNINNVLARFEGKKMGVCKRVDVRPSVRECQIKIKRWKMNRVESGPSGKWNECENLNNGRLLIFFMSKARNLKVFSSYKMCSCRTSLSRRVSHSFVLIF